MATRIEHDAIESLRRRVRPKHDVLAGPSDGVRALFSQTPAMPSNGAVRVTCSKCGVDSIVSMARLVRLAIPTVVVAWPSHGVTCRWRCPACQRRTWGRVSR